jgi:hypothetical protein
MTTGVPPEPPDPEPRTRSAGVLGRMLLLPLVQLIGGAIVSLASAPCWGARSLVASWVSGGGLLLVFVLHVAALNALCWGLAK